MLTGARDMPYRLQIDRYAPTPRDKIASPAQCVPTVAQVPAERVLALQRGAGNRAVWSILARRATGNDSATPVVRRKAGIHVHKGSKLSSAQFVNALTANKKVPGWLAKRLASSNGSLVLSGKLDAPRDRIWLFVDAFADAIKSGGWEITTAKSTIEVKEDADKKRTWTQLVLPDLQNGEHLGTWAKTGPGREELLQTSLFSDLSEVIYGWTQPDQATELTRDKRGFIVIVTEIEVTAPNGKKRVFRPSPDNIAEAILHEISVHAGRITEGRPDIHDDRDTAVKCGPRRRHQMPHARVQQAVPGLRIVGPAPKRRDAFYATAAPIAYICMR